MEFSPTCTQAFALQWACFAQQAFRTVFKSVTSKLSSLTFFKIFTTYLAITSTTTITDIQGPAFLSPLLGQTVHGVTGVVTAKGSNGFYIRGDPVKDIRVSNGLNIFTTSTTVLNKVAVGDLVSLSGKVAEFRSTSRPNDLSTTELTAPTDILVISSHNPVFPIILGKDRSPPTQHLSALDTGPDGFLSVPNAQSRIETENVTLQPDKFGIDFWESLEGQLVAVPKPVALDFENRFGEFWVHGDWPVTGKNSRGGLTITFGPDGIPDANPESIIIGRPLDGTKNPKVSIGTRLTNITGVVTYQSGFYYLLPLTAPAVISTPSPTVPPTRLTSKLRDACDITIGDYNVENMAPKSRHLPTVAGHISKHLGTPDLLFVQEIQDDSGPVDDGTVSANLTLSNLVAAIATASGGVKYKFVQIDPADQQDGGQPGGNIRQVYLYRPEKLTLVSGSPAGGALDATTVILDSFGKPKLSFNPGRIDPTNEAWTASRKPLAAAWRTSLGHRLFTVNVHFSSKGGSDSTQGNTRTPVNLPVERRTSQVKTVSTFVKSILAEDSQANIIVAGDFNEFVQTRSVYSSLMGALTHIDEAADIPPVERYSYVFDQNTEQLDHIFVSGAIKGRKPEAEHIHVNNWAPSISARVSDHDPTVGQIRVC